MLPLIDRTERVRIIPERRILARHAVTLHEIMPILERPATITHRDASDRRDAPIGCAHGECLGRRGSVGLPARYILAPRVVMDKCASLGREPHAMKPVIRLKCEGHALRAA